MIVHSPYCEWAWKIHPDNWVTFDSIHEAVSCGYSECGDCIEERRKIIRVEQARKEIKSQFFGECICCQEKRGIQKAHIIPKRFRSDSRTMPLCPNHHWNYDHNLLTEKERNKIEIWKKMELSR